MWKREYIERFWSLPFDNLLERLETSPSGLTDAEAKRRLQFYGRNRLRPTKTTDTVTLVLAQFKSPLILILLVAVVLSFFLNEPVDALIIIAIVMLSSVLGFWQVSSFSTPASQADPVEQFSH